MKGVIFSVLEEVVVDRFGEDVWDDTLRRARLDGVYTSLGDYPDSEVFGIIDALAAQLGVSAADVQVLGGQAGFSALAGRHPHLITDFAGWRDLLMHLDDIIHPEVHKIYAGANAPSFSATATSDGITLRYSSSRRLCRLAEGLAKGAGDWFGATLTVHHESCIELGDPQCVLVVREQ